MWNHRIGGIFLVLILSGCASFSKVEPGNAVARGKFSITLDVAWNKWQGPQNDGGELWTRDGVTLDTLMFYGPVKAAEPLWTVRQRTEKSIPKFRANMQPHEIVELYESMATLDGSAFQLVKLLPTSFLDGDGFRFEFSMTRKNDELSMSGLGFGAVRGGELYLMVYRAPKLHFFARHLPSVEAIARSAKLAG